MNPEEQDLNTNELTPEEAKASLGLATRMSEQLLMSQAQPQEEVAQDTPPETPESPETQVEPENEEVPIEEETEPEEPAEEVEYEDASEEMEDMKTDIKLLKKAVIGEENGTE